MPVEFICDACGKREESPRYVHGFGWVKPHKWYGRTDKETGKSYVACSRKCTKELGGLHAPW